jgi:hypothetical protein
MRRENEAHTEEEEGEEFADLQMRPTHVYLYIFPETSTLLQNNKNEP